MEMEKTAIMVIEENGTYITGDTIEEKFSEIVEEAEEVEFVENLLGLGKWRQVVRAKICGFSYTFFTT